jgi:hypothetical protein
LDVVEQLNAMKMTEPTTGCLMASSLFHSSPFVFFIARVKNKIKNHSIHPLKLGLRSNVSLLKQQKFASYLSNIASVPLAFAIDSIAFLLR